MSAARDKIERAVIASNELRVAAATYARALQVKSVPGFLESCGKDLEIAALAYAAAVAEVQP